MRKAGLRLIIIALCVTSGIWGDTQVASARVRINMNYESCTKKSASWYPELQNRMKFPGEQVDEACDNDQAPLIPADVQAFFGGGSPSPSSTLDPACTLAALKNSSQTGESMPYFVCDSKSGAPKRVRTRPCLNEKYHKAIHANFEAAVECAAKFPTPKLGADDSHAKNLQRLRWAELTKDAGRLKREIFTIFAHESRMHMNVRSGIGNFGGWGAAQLTSPAINEINRLFPKFSSMKKVPECQQIGYAMGKQIEKPEKYSTRACGTIQAPENPSRSIVYGTLFQLVAKLQAQEVLEGWVANNPKLLDDVERDKFASLISQWMYNAGPPAIKAAVAGFIEKLERDKRKMKKPGPDPRVMNVREFYQQFSTYMPAAYGRILARKKDLHQYEGQIKDALDYPKKIARDMHQIDCIAKGEPVNCDNPWAEDKPRDLCIYDVLE